MQWAYDRLAVKLNHLLVSRWTLQMSFSNSSVILDVPFRTTNVHIPLSNRFLFDSHTCLLWCRRHRRRCQRERYRRDTLKSLRRLEMDCHQASESMCEISWAKSTTKTWESNHFCCLPTSSKTSYSLSSRPAPFPLPTHVIASNIAKTIKTKTTTMNGNFVLILVSVAVESPITS